MCAAMAELRTDTTDAASEQPEVIMISDEEALPELTGNPRPISVVLEEFKTLIQPVPKDKGNTFNRAEYQVSPVLTKRTEEANRVMTEFLDACIPHLRERDLRYILERLKSLLCQTNLHYLASHGFQHNVIQLTKSIRSEGLAYMHLKNLTDELRAHREKKPKEKEQPQNSAPPAATPTATPAAGMQASTSGVAGRLNQSCAAARPASPRSLPNTGASNKPPAAEVSGLRGSRSGPPSPSSVSSTTAVQKPNSPRISIGEQPGTSGPAGSVGNPGHGRKEMGREVKEQRQWNGAGCHLNKNNGPSRRDAKNIEKLREYLLELCKHIRKLREEEVDLNEDDEASAYIQEDRLTKRAWNVWRKICKLEGKRPRTGCEQEKPFKFTETHYHQAITEGVESLVNKKIFPDFTDIRNLVKRANEQEDLGFGPGEIQTIAEEVFTKVGQQLQRRRQKDELVNVMAYLEDYCGSLGHDPAESDPVLKAKLEENAKVYSKKMDDVIQAYVNKQQELKLEPQEVKEEDCDRSPDPEGNNSSEDEEGDKKDNSIEDDMKNLEKDHLLNSSVSEGEQGAEEKAGDVCKPLCAAGSPASLAAKESSKSPVAADELGLAPTGYSNSATQLSIKPVPGGPLSSGPSGDSSGIAQLNSIPVCTSADVTITRVPATTTGAAELTIITVPVATATTHRSISQVPIATAKGEGRHGTKNGTIVMPELSIFKIVDDKVNPGPKDGSNGRKLPVKRQRCSPEKGRGEHVITILSDDDEASVPPAKTTKC